MIEIQAESNKLSKKQKTQKWGEGQILYFEKLAFQDGHGNRITNYRKAVNYDLFNGRFNQADFQYVTNPLGLKQNEFPAVLQNYDIITTPLRNLIGEESTKPDNRSEEHTSEFQSRQYL